MEMDRDVKRKFNVEEFLDCQVTTNLSKRRKSLSRYLRDDDAAALLHDLGKSSRSQSPENSSSGKTEDEGKSLPPSPTFPMIVPLSINMNRPTIPSQPANLYGYGMHDMYIPTLPPYSSFVPTNGHRMCVHNMHGPYCTCASIHHHMYSPVNQIQHHAEPLAHPAQITIGPDSILHQTLTDSPRKGASKRNKFFYKEVKDHLEGESPMNIGFVNEFFFIMDPKLHVGPINRDGTFEKRVRLHFIDWIELKQPLSQQWLCWGTLFDSNNHPVFRENGVIYRIPGNQSSLIKSNKTIQGWTVVDDNQKTALHEQATTIQKILDEKWDGASIADAKTLVKTLDIPSNNFITKNIGTEDFDLLHSAKSIADLLWTYLGFSLDEVNNVEVDEIAKKQLVTSLGLIDKVEAGLAIFYALTGNTPTSMSLDKLTLGIKLFGSPKFMIKNMTSLLTSGCFNGNMTSEGAKIFLDKVEIGSFLLRFSQSSPEMFCVAFKNEKGKVVQQHNIGYCLSSNMLRIDDNEYKSWQDFIEKKNHLIYPKLSLENRELVSLVKLAATL